MEKRGMHVSLWIAQGLLALFFVMAGIAHGLLPIAQVAKSAPWTADLPVGLVRFIGIAELAGAIGVLLPAALRILPWLTPLAAFGLMLIMLLAIPFHISRGEARIVGMHIVVACVAAFVAWGRFRKAPVDPR
jgi:putative oxidoreductase